MPSNLFVIESVRESRLAYLARMANFLGYLAEDRNVTQTTTELLVLVCGPSTTFR